MPPTLENFKGCRLMPPTLGPNWAQGPFGPNMFSDFWDGAGGLPGQFGTFYDFFGRVKILTFFGKIFLHKSPPT